MKYNIFINQEKLSKDRELSLSDCAVFDYLHTICGSDSDKISSKRLEGFTWVNLNHLIQEMPLLRLKTISGASKIVKKLSKLGYVTTITKDRKLYIKPTAKMKSIFFGEVVAYGQQDVSCGQGDRCLQATNHNTRDTNTKTVISTVADTQQIPAGVRLPDNRGKTPQDRLISIYCSLFNKTYAVVPKINFGLFKKVFTDLLKNYSEVQIAYLLIVYFNWKGMSGDDVKEYNYLTGIAFPIYMFKSSITKYEIYVRNVLKIDIDNDQNTLKLIAEFMLSTR